MARASTVRRRKRKPAGTDIEPDPRVEKSHVGFLRTWAGTLNGVQREHFPEIRELIVAEQERLGTRSDSNVLSSVHALSKCGRARSDQLPKSIRTVNQLIAEMLGEYAVKVARGSTQAEGRAGTIEGALESTSATAWADNIESLVQQSARLNAGQKTELSDFLIAEEPDIPKSVRRSWIREQLALISGKPIAPVRVAGRLIETISGRSMKRLNSIVTKGILKGTRVETIMRDLAELPGITSRHAENLARDQVVKQNGRMTRIRHEGIGVTHYTWQNVGDQRVRKTHRARQGKRYSYAKGPPGGLNPGLEPLCRCWASPDLAGALASLRKRNRGDSMRRLPRRLRVSRLPVEVRQLAEPIGILR